LANKVEYIVIAGRRASATKQAIPNFHTFTTSNINRFNFTFRIAFTGHINGKLQIKMPSHVAHVRWMETPLKLQADYDNSEMLTGAWLHALTLPAS